MRSLVIVLVTGLLASIHATSEVDSTHEEETTSPPSPDTEDARQKFLFGSFSTTRYTQVAVTTSTVFFSCLSGTATGTVCTGRNARRLKQPKARLLTLEQKDKNAELDGTLNVEAAGDAVNPQENGGRFAFTVWTTSRTTTSVTVFYTNTSTTLRLSYFCLAGGIRYPQFNCQIAG